MLIAAARSLGDASSHSASYSSRIKLRADQTALYDQAAKYKPCSICRHAFGLSPTRNPGLLKNNIRWAVRMLVVAGFLSCLGGSVALASGTMCDPWARSLGVISPACLIAITWLWLAVENRKHEACLGDCENGGGLLATSLQPLLEHEKDQHGEKETSKTGATLLGQNVQVQVQSTSSDTEEADDKAAVEGGPERNMECLVGFLQHLDVVWVTNVTGTTAVDRMLFWKYINANRR